MIRTYAAALLARLAWNYRATAALCDQVADRLLADPKEMFRG